jgi:pectate lyase
MPLPPLSPSKYPVNRLDLHPLDTNTPPSDNAGMLGITVGSNKSLIGEGTSGVIKGRGLRMVSGVENIIIQYVLALPLIQARRLHWNSR